MVKVSIVIPAYNEEESMRPLLSSIVSAVLPLIEYKFDVILVDDGSTDQTLSVMKTMADETEIQIKILSLSRNFGKTEALRTAFGHADGDYIVLMDADLQDSPEDISRFIESLNQFPVDVVVGNRINRYQKNYIKNISSKIANLSARFLTGLNIHDMNCGFKILRRSAMQDLVLKSDYHRFIPLICAANGYRVMEIPLKQHKRHFGTSKYGATGLLRFMKSVVDGLGIVFVLRFRRDPFNFFGKGGVLFFTSGFAILIYLSIGWFMGIYILSRPLFFLGILLLILGINLISLGFLAELISHRDGSQRYQIKEKYEKPHLQ